MSRKPPAKPVEYFEEDEEDEDEFDEEEDDEEEEDEDDSLIIQDEDEDEVALANQPVFSLSQVRAKLAVFGDGAIDVRRSRVAGLGLFAGRAFEKGEMITEYSGNFITREESVRRLGKTDSHIRTHIGRRWDIDGLRQPQVGRGAASFANDAAPPLKANSVFDFVDSQLAERDVERFFKGAPAIFRPEERITFLRASRAIARGEEIFVDYGQDTRARYMKQ